MKDNKNTTKGQTKSSATGSMKSTTAGSTKKSPTACGSSTSSKK